MKRIFFLATLAAFSVFAAAQGATNAQATPPKADQAAPAVTSKTYSDYEIGMAFDYPSNWVMVADPKPGKGNPIDAIIGKKSKKNKKLANGKQAHGEGLFYVPAGTRTANFEVYSALWSDTPDLWETVQADANKQLNRQVVKQWREEILGVPLLLTKIAYDDAAGHEVGLVGLVYSRTPYKMAFRLTCDDENYDAAEYSIRQTLQSLRTLDGGLPQPEDPNHPLDKTAYTSVVNKPRAEVVITGHRPDPKHVKKGTVSLSQTVSGKNYVLTMPDGWTSTVATDGTITLHSAAVSGDVVVNLATTLDADPPQGVIIRNSGKSLDLFTKVDARNENIDQLTTGGATTDTVWRTGTGAKGALFTCDSVGSTNEAYWILRYQLDGTITPAAKKALEALIDGLSLDPAS
jgi:hypothetical protein